MKNEYLFSILTGEQYCKISKNKIKKSEVDNSLKDKFGPVLNLRSFSAQA